MGGDFVYRVLIYNSTEVVCRVDYDSEISALNLGAMAYRCFGAIGAAVYRLNALSEPEELVRFYDFL